MFVSLLSALSLVFVIEGLIPFAWPKRWKKFLKKIVAQDEKMLRISGFLSMMIGLILLTVVHQFID